MLSDPTPWRGSADRPPPPQLSAAQDAVIAGKELRLEYVDRAGTPTTRRVDPLGIVAKGAQWYLVADTDAGRRTFRVDRIRSLEPTGKPAARPEDFDLATAWGELLAEMVSPADLVVATGHIDAEYVGVLRFLLGQRVAVGRPDGEGRVDVVLRGRSPGLLASEIAGLAHHLELTGPPEVREALAALGAQLLKRYASHGQDAVASQTSEG
jgi:predicted DNA-binding transcriptional regulator YafY